MCLSPLEDESDVMEFSFLDPGVILKRETLPPDQEECLQASGSTNSDLFFLQDGLRNKEG